MRTTNLHHCAPRTTIIDDSITINTSFTNNGNIFDGLGLGTGGLNWGSCGCNPLGWSWGGGCNCNGGSFWGGFANGLGNFFGGFLGGFSMSGLCGGWGLGGWGMGACSPWAWNWGSGRGGSATPATTSTTPSTTSCTNKDEETFNKLWDEFIAIQKTPDRAKAHDLYKRVLAKIDKPEDDAHKAQDIKNYEKIKLQLESLAKAQNWGDISKPEDTSSSNGGDGNHVDGTSGSSGSGGAGSTSGANNDGLDELGALTQDELKDLRNLGVKLITVYAGKPKALTLPTDETKLTKANLTKIADIAKRLKLGVAVANNPGAGKDKWIAGTIDSSKITETNGKLSYEIECKVGDNKEVYGSYGFTYKVEAKGDHKYDVSCINATTGYTTNKRTYTYNSEGKLFRDEKNEVVNKNN